MSAKTNKSPEPDATVSKGSESLTDAAAAVTEELTPEKKAGPGRPRLTDEQKAERAAERAEKKPKTRQRKETPVETFTPIEPEQIAKLLMVASTITCARIGVTPLSEEECDSGGEAIAPIMDLYFPDFATKVGPWGALLYWGFSITLPRYQEYQLIRAESAPPAPDPVDGVPPGEWSDDRPEHLRGPVV